MPTWTYEPNSTLSNMISFAISKEIPLKSSAISLMAVSGTKTWAKYWEEDCGAQRSLFNIPVWIKISVKVFKITAKPLDP